MLRVTARISHGTHASVGSQPANIANPIGTVMQKSALTRSAARAERGEINRGNFALMKRAASFPPGKFLAHCVAGNVTRAKKTPKLISVSTFLFVFSEK